MNRSSTLRLLFSLSFAATALVAAPALAGSHGNGSAGSGMAQHGNGADLPQYRYQAEAEKACNGDAVVWGSSEHRGVFFTADSGVRRIGGAYACMGQARKAGYQIVSGN